MAAQYPAGLDLMGVGKVINAAVPSNPGDLVNLQTLTAQIASALAGLPNKPAVNTVATANVSTLSGVGGVINGVTVAAGMRVLLTAQSTAAQNGVWVAASGAWTLPADQGATDEITPGAVWAVAPGGGTYDGTSWRLTNTGTLTPGTTALTIVQAASAQTYTNGLGLLLSAGSFAINTGQVCQIYKQTIGDGTSTAFSLTHNFNSTNVWGFATNVASPYGKIFPDVTSTSANVASASFGSLVLTSGQCVMTLIGGA